MAHTARIGLIGFGTVGAFVYEQIAAHPEWGLEIAFVASRSAKNLPAGQEVPDLGDLSRFRTALVVEMAHPSVSAEFGESILRTTDYMPLSLTALADEALEARLRDTAQSCGTRLYIPHGAAAGLDTLSECRDIWDEVTVVMTKNPRNLDFSEAPDLASAAAVRATTLYDGPTRGVCAMFPRNVNAHAAVALAGIGFDRTRSVLIADPAVDASVIELSARGGDVALRIERSNPLKGVSGVLTMRSILGCIQRAKAPGVSFQIC